MFEHVFTVHFAVFFKGGLIGNQANTLKYAATTSEISRPEMFDHNAHKLFPDSTDKQKKGKLIKSLNHTRRNSGASATQQLLS